MKKKIAAAAAAVALAAAGVLGVTWLGSEPEAVTVAGNSWT